jgi:spore coat protein U-like protein
MKRRITVLLVLGILPWAGLNAQQTASTTFRVSANVQAVCAVTAQDLNFGVYNAQGGSPLLATTAVMATCSPGTSYNIGLNEGSTGGTITQRRMASGTNTLNYQLYSDTSRSTIWGNTTGSDTVTGVGTGLAVGHVVHGSVPAAQAVPAGAYGDTITVRISY